MMWENGVVDNDSPTALACCSSVRLADTAASRIVIVCVRSFLIVSDSGFIARIDVDREPILVS